MSIKKICLFGTPFYLMACGSQMHTPEKVVGLYYNNLLEQNFTKAADYLYSEKEKKILIYTSDGDEGFKENLSITRFVKVDGCGEPVLIAGFDEIECDVVFNVFRSEPTFLDLKAGSWKKREGSVTLRRSTKTGGKWGVVLHWVSP